MGLSLLSAVPLLRHDVWHGDQLGVSDVQVLGTGHAALDAELPGGGWPIGALTEVLQAAPEAHVWQLLLPALARAVAARGGPVVLIGAPHAPFSPALVASGLPVEALMWIRAATPTVEMPAMGAPARFAKKPSSGPASLSVAAHTSRLWACEQALRCADVSVVLAWLPQARVSELRRLQLAAAQHEGLLFVFRPESAAHSASPARLRLRLASAADGQMELHLLKRRGPPLAQPLVLTVRSERITALLAASLSRRQQRRQQAVPLQGEALLEQPALQPGTVVRRQEPGATVVRLAFPQNGG